jgi:hypothetical protein
MSGSPVIRPAPDLPPGPRAALVVATTSYADPVLRKLRSPATDATELAAVLADPAIGGFEVTTVLDPTAQQLRIAVHDFLDARGPEQLVVVYLSCHGLTDLRRRLYFAATDTYKARLAATGVESSWLLDRLNECRPRSQVLILDCCFSGAFARGGKGAEDFDLRDQLVPAGRGQAVLTASNAREYSFEGDLGGAVGLGETAPGSVFTSALLEGLRTGAADADRDGWITVDEAYDYAFREVRAASAAQTPQRWLDAGEGHIVLARNPAGAQVMPVSVPAALRAAIESPYPYVRLGAVDELADWLASGEPSRQLAARQILEDIANKDTPRVAAAARLLLPPVTPGPDEPPRNDVNALLGPQSPLDRPTAGQPAAHTPRPRSTNPVWPSRLRQLGLAIPERVRQGLNVATRSPRDGSAVRFRYRYWWLASLVGISVVAIILWFGSRPDPNSDSSNSTSTASTAPSERAPSSSVRSESTAPIVGADLYDPFGDGEAENPDQLPLSFDGNPDTAWSTFYYRQKQFGTLKPGTGALYDLGEPRTVVVAQLKTTHSGAVVEVRVGDNPTAPLDDFPIVAAAQLLEDTEIHIANPLKARYVLVWITALAPAEEGYAADLSEVSVRTTS